MFLSDRKRDPLGATDSDAQKAVDYLLGLQPPP
jgi:hypothetical protein